MGQAYFNHINTVVFAVFLFSILTIKAQAQEHEGGVYTHPDIRMTLFGMVEIDRRYAQN